MKRIINLASILLIILSIGVLIHVYSTKQSFSGNTLVAKGDVGDFLPYNSFPIDETAYIEIDADDEIFESFTRREKEDQIKDWMLFLLISESGLSEEEISKNIFDFPAIRQGYLAPVSTFEYGETRSCLINESEIIALIPTFNDKEELLTENEINDHLAHIADNHRKNSGEIIPKIIPFYYEIDDIDEAVLITQKNPVKTADLFTSKMGYFEKEVRNLQDMKEVMNKISDVTFVEWKARKLKIGGRKMKSYKYRGIEVEDIAAVWQSEKKIKQEVKAFNDYWDDKLSELNASYSRTTSNFSTKAAYDKDYNQLNEDMSKAWIEKKIVDGSGFSLDPGYDHQGLLQYFKEFQSSLLLFASFNEVEVSESKLYDVEQALRDKNELPLLILMNDIQPGLHESLSEYRYQKSRYDGHLDGTEVGMVLFYTDLIAKLWALDYLGHTPSNQIEDFTAMLKVKISPIYEREYEEMSSTRLWFGTDDEGFQTANENNSIFFARNATRIYAASSNDLAPGEEAQPTAVSQAYLGWWNDHYEEVAKFEPEYQRLDQIMKWSLIIGWLNQNHYGVGLDFLENVKVDKSNWFPKWVEENKQLKFKNWDKVGFYEPGYKGADTEAMPILYSDTYEGSTLSGGVSLAPKTLFKARTAVNTNFVKGMRTSKIDYGLSSRNMIKTFDGSEFSFARSTSGNGFETLAVPKAGTKMRGKFAQLENGQVAKQINLRGNDFQVQTKVSSKDLGTLKIDKGNMKISWKVEDISAGQNIAAKLSKSYNPRQTLLNDPMVETVIQLEGQNAFLIKLNNSKQWVKLKPESAPSPIIEPGWTSRVCDTKYGFRNMNVKWVEQGNVLSEMGTTHIRGVIDAKTGNVFWKNSTQNLKVGEGVPFEMNYNSGNIKGLVNKSTGDIILKVDQIPAAAKSNFNNLQKIIGKQDILSINQLAKSGKSTYTSKTSFLNDKVGILKDVQGKKFNAAAEKIVQNPADARQLVGQQRKLSKNKVEDLLAKGEQKKAGSLLEQLESTFGKTDELAGLKQRVETCKDISKINKSPEKVFALKVEINGPNMKVYDGRSPARTLKADQLNKLAEDLNSIYKFADESTVYFDVSGATPQYTNNFMSTMRIHTGMKSGKYSAKRMPTNKSARELYFKGRPKLIDKAAPKISKLADGTFVGTRSYRTWFKGNWQNMKIRIKGATEAIVRDAFRIFDGLLQKYAPGIKLGRKKVSDIVGETKRELSRKYKELSPDDIEIMFEDNLSTFHIVFNNFSGKNDISYDMVT